MSFFTCRRPKSIKLRRASIFSIDIFSINSIPLVTVNTVQTVLRPQPAIEGQFGIQGRITRELF
jgi:hypothetical protein